MEMDFNPTVEKVSKLSTHVNLSTTISWKWPLGSFLHMIYCYTIDMCYHVTMLLCVSDCAVLPCKLWLWRQLVGGCWDWTGDLTGTAGCHHSPASRHNQHSQQHYQHQQHQYYQHYQQQHQHIQQQQHYQHQQHQYYQHYQQQTGKYLINLLWRRHFLTVIFIDHQLAEGRGIIDKVV